MVHLNRGNHIRNTHLGKYIVEYTFRKSCFMAPLTCYRETVDTCRNATLLDITCHDSFLLTLFYLNELFKCFTHSVQVS